jgi:hypothetical protein
MSGHWPPERDDPSEWDESGEDSTERHDELDAAVTAEAAEARLAEVSAFLASVGDPVLPAAVEARISAAIAAEAAARTPATETGGTETRIPEALHAPEASTAEAGTAGGTLRTDIVLERTQRNRRGPRPRRNLRLRMAASGSLLACLLLAGLGYGLSRGGTSGSTAQSSTGQSSTGQSSAASAEAAAPAAQPPGDQVPSAGGLPRPQPSRLTASRPAASASFSVTESGTSYREATLAGQVREQLAAGGSAARHAPTQGLLGCVLHVTDDAPPQLVDLASYEGKPAYVIAGSNRVWVVGLGCSAAKPEVIASVALTG